MNIIFSHTQDYTTKLVLEWVDYLGGNFLRINDERIDLKEVTINNETYSYSFQIGEKQYLNSELSSKWFRGGKIRISNNINNFFLFDRDLNKHSESAELFMTNYKHAKLEYLVNEFSDSVGTNAQGRYNKLIALRNARNTGLDIPNTILTTSKSKLLTFFQKNERIITKSLDLNFSSSETDSKGYRTRYMQYTNEINLHDVNKFSDEFALTLFQQLISKKFEIRTFYLNHKCHSVAIFSQQNKKTSVDYRKYDHQKMNRMIPFKLPVDIEAKIDQFMKTCGLNTGSIDLIYSTEGNFIFLEVNPIGQFGYISDVSNYKLHKEIAQCIINSTYK
jgi:ATP-GRASP peptide maturase of grasp-with-spasm system